MVCAQSFPARRYKLNIIQAVFRGSDTVSMKGPCLIDVSTAIAASVRDGRVHVQMSEINISFVSKTSASQVDLAVTGHY